MTTLLAVLLGGFAGAVARQELFSALQQRVSTRFPVGILAVNLSGAFVLGLLFGLDIDSRWPDWLATGAEAGLIGAYTTYSTWAVDSLALIRRGASRSAVINLAGSLAAGVPLAWAGASVGAAVLAGPRELVKISQSCLGPGITLCMVSPGTPMILAAYVCTPCDIQGRDREVSPGLVLCWNCGGPAFITARISEVR